MKCADCKLWKLLDDGSDQTDDPAMGACHRYAPRATFVEALSVAALLVSEGSLDIDPARPRDTYGHVEPWYQRTTAWPVTRGTDFCGEFVAAKSPSFV